MNSIKIKFPIFIADGGENLQFIDHIRSQNLSNLNFTYNHFGQDVTYQNYFEKIYSALSKVSSKYSVLADDDDFFLETGLTKSIEFLNNSEDYSSCGGKQGGIYNQSALGEFDGNYRLIESIYKRIPLESNDSLERVFNHLIDYSSIYYDVHKTEDIRDIYHSICKMKLHDLYMVEHYFQIASLMNGKNKKLNYPYLVRQHNNPTSSARYSFGGGAFKRMQVDTWTLDYENFIESLSMRIKLKDPYIDKSILISFQDKYDLFLEDLVEKEKISSLNRYDKVLSKLNIKKLMKIMTLLFPFFYSKIREIKVKNNRLSCFSKLKFTNNKYRSIVLFLKHYGNLDSK
tara:strand:- start:154 stop:1185 length:1032 start_codon:yes stop_codon:yes gene_type:complete